MKFSQICMLFGMSLGAFQCGVGHNNQQMKSTWFVAGETPALDGKQLGYAGTVSGVSNHHLLIIGGANFPDKMPWNGGTKKYYNVINCYQKNTNGTLKWLKQFQVGQNTAYGAYCSTPEGLVVAGGENENGLQKEVNLYIWKNDSVQIKKLPDLPMPVTNAQMTYLNGKLYLAGGENATQTFDTFWVLDVAKDTAWQALEKLPQASSNAVLTSYQNQIYLVGGRQKHTGALTTFFNQAFVYTVSSRQWQALSEMPYPLAAHSGLVSNGKLLIFSGDKGKTFNRTEALIYQINQTENAILKQQLVDEKAQLQETHPGFSTQVLSYDFVQQQWTEIDSIPFSGQVTTSIVQWDDVIYIANGEIRAGVRTPQITGFRTQNLVSK